MRGSALTAYRQQKWQFFFSPGLQFQPNVSLLQVTLPLGVTVWKGDRFSVSAELSTSLNFWDGIDKPFVARINPTLGLEF